MTSIPVWEPPSLGTRIVTERLVMRPARSTDVSEVRRALRANVTHLQPWTAAATAGEDPSSLTVISRAVVRYRREWKRGQSFVFLLLPRSDETRVLGRITLNGVLRGAYQNAYLGYWIDAAEQNRGLMTESVRAVTTFAFGAAGLHRVQAAVMPRNLASQRVLQKAGYRREGHAPRYLCIAGAWQDHDIFAVTAEEWAG